MTAHICDYGCGKEAHYQFKNGKWCCEESWNSCPVSIKNKIYSLKEKKEKYPFFCQVEELREDPKTGEIQGHCKNHNCKNSKEKGGWFTLSYTQIYERIRQLESENGNDGSYFYCSQKCKDECILYGKTAKQFMKQDLINAGHIPENLNQEGTEIWRQEVLKRNIEEYGKLQCEICGNTNIDELSVHHEMPQKTHPEMALDPINGWVLCGFGKGNNCHLKIGHQGDCSTGALAKLICERKYRKEKK